MNNRGKFVIGILLLTIFTIALGVFVVKSDQSKDQTADSSTDPYLWLEDITGEKALAWVRERNQKTLSYFESNVAFTNLRKDLLDILNSDDRIPMVTKRGDFYYNFWRDQANPRGLWRRTTLSSYRTKNPEWETILNLDELAKVENENWVWAGASVLKPDYDLAIVSLSRGGGDAKVDREFDIKTRAFVSSGFSKPEAKGGLNWVDRDHVFAATDFGPDSMTSSGYPRIVKLWKRGTDMKDARIIFEGNVDDVGVSGYAQKTPGYERKFIHRNKTFYTNELYVLGEDYSPTKIDAPDSATKSIYRDELFLELREPYAVAGTEYPKGSLLVTSFERFMNGERSFQVLFSPTDSTSLSSFDITKDYVLLNVLRDVKNEIVALKKENGLWKEASFPGVPEIGSTDVWAVDSDESNEFWMTTSDYLNPTTLFFGEVGKAPEALKTLSRLFNSDGLQVTQHFATSADGTKVPYFMVARKDLVLDGKNPTLLYGYGGFEVSLRPHYSPGVGRAWLEEGGVEVIANIRGGGEYGPRWHQAALKENRLRAYEDFAAVAQDIVARKVTSKEHLGIQGGSNGGLLVGNMVTRYPDLFSVAVCQVPLLDMRRYHKLLAGASWMAEYGDPDDPKQWEFIQHFSPYQNVSADKKYPSVFFMTSTRDDRVHPGHARKMMALMEQQTHDVIYFENIEGGHGGAANNEQQANMQALTYSYLKERLFRH